MLDQDSGYKLLFSHPDMVRDLLLGFVKEAWVERLDFSSLEKMGGSYVTDDLRDREDDVIWRVRWGTEWLFIYLLMEFQSTVDWTMSIRTDAYVMLLYQDLVKSGMVKNGARLPPVLPVVLYNGKPVWTAAMDVADLVAPVPGGLERYRPRMRYLLIDVVRYGNAELASMHNLVAALCRLEKSQTPEEIRAVVCLLADWLKAPEQLSLRRAFTVMLGRVLLPRRVSGQMIPELNDLKEVDAMLAETVGEWTKEWELKGERKGEKKGEKKGEITILTRQLQRRFGSVPEWANQKIAGAELSSLEEWSLRILDAQSMDEVFENKT
ncbi:MAG: Rpn family recombination-promoting nuclease/putative transposase [Magnetococcales bacterium]|nr:Rpn family recombination-promoting nuclease/putative transposase [Magnetococcales bacterium]